MTRVDGKIKSKVKDGKGNVPGYISIWPKKSIARTGAVSPALGGISRSDRASSALRNKIRESKFRIGWKGEGTYSSGADVLEHAAMNTSAAHRRCKICGTSGLKEIIWPYLQRCVRGLRVGK